MGTGQTRQHSILLASFLSQGDVDRSEGQNEVVQNDGKDLIETRESDNGIQTGPTQGDYNFPKQSNTMWLDQEATLLSSHRSASSEEGWCTEDSESTNSPITYVGRCGSDNKICNLSRAVSGDWAVQEGFESSSLSNKSISTLTTLLKEDTDTPTVIMSLREIRRTMLTRELTNVQPKSESVADEFDYVAPWHGSRRFNLSSEMVRERWINGSLKFKCQGRTNSIENWMAEDVAVDTIVWGDPWRLVMSSDTLRLVDWHH